MKTKNTLFGIILFCVVVLTTPTSSQAFFESFPRSQMAAVITTISDLIAQIQFLQNKLEAITNSDNQSSSITQAETDDKGTEEYMMLSAYNLEPYTDTYKSNVLAELARNNTAGIIYSTVGEISEKLGEDEIDFNTRVYQEAKETDAPLWLQMRVYANEISIPGESGKHNVSASEILDKDSNVIRKALRDRVKKEFTAYNKYFADECRVIVFEEAGIYHSPQGGGTFWSDPEPVISKPTEEYDYMFANRMVRLFHLLNYYIKTINPDCEVGMHLGHSVLINEDVLVERMNWLEGKGYLPDFIFYDLYVDVQPDYSSYSKKLTERKKVMDGLGIPSMHLSQLHTTNAFQKGMGRTPSKSDIDDSIKLDDSLGFDGVGYYTKNALATINFDEEPFYPNEKAQRTVYESSKNRWDYAMRLLLERNGVNPGNLFDLILHGRFTQGRYDVYLKNLTTNNWDFIGKIDPEIRPNYKEPETVAMRNLDASTYINNGVAQLRFDAADNFFKGRVENISLAQSAMLSDFKSAEELETIYIADNSASEIGKHDGRIWLTKDSTYITTTP